MLGIGLGAIFRSILLGVKTFLLWFINNCPKGIRRPLTKPWIGICYMLLATIYIYHKSSVKTFLLWFINNYPKDVRLHDPEYFKN